LLLKFNYNRFVSN